MMCMSLEIPTPSRKKSMTQDIPELLSFTKINYIKFWNNFSSTFHSTRYNYLQSRNIQVIVLTLCPASVRVHLFPRAFCSCARSSAGLKTPNSVTIPPVMRDAGVTSNAGFQTPIPDGNANKFRKLKSGCLVGSCSFKCSYNLKLTVTCNMESDHTSQFPYLRLSHKFVNPFTHKISLVQLITS